MGLWILLAVIGVITMALISSLMALALTRVPVVRTPKEYLETIRAEAGITADDTVVDAGCGDGRTLLGLCAGGAKGRGYELNGPVALLAWWRARVSSQRRQLRIHWSDFFRCELEDVSVVFCFLMPGSLPRLAEKCITELPAGARVLSYSFPIPGWREERVLALGKRADPLHIYVLPSAAQPQEPPSAAQVSGQAAPETPGPKT